MNGTGGPRMALLRTIVWFLYFFGALVALVPQMICAQRKKAAGAPGAKAYIHRYVRMWAARCCALRALLSR